MFPPLSGCTTATLLAWLLLPHLTLAQDGAIDGFDVFVTPTDNEVVAAGSNFDIIWTPSDPAGPVTIRLMQGDTELTQEFGPTIASGIDSTLGIYTWSIPPSYGDYPSYGFKLQLDSNTTIFQYSYPFIIKKAATQASASTPLQLVPTSTVIASSTSIVLITQSSTPSSEKPVTTPQAATSSSSIPNTSASIISSTTEPVAISSSTGSGIISSPSIISPSTISLQTTSSSSNPTGISSTSTTIDGLSVGAKIGIGVGVAIGLCIIILLIYIVILMRQKNDNRGALLGDHEEAAMKISEMGSSSVMHEMEVREEPAELSTGEDFKFYQSGDGGGGRRLDGIAELG